MGSAGSQVRIRDIDKVDNQSTQNGYLHAVKVTSIFDTEQGSPGAGIILYATTDNVWSDDYVITSSGLWYCMPGWAQPTTWAGLANS